jgi:hypothetical protein
MNELAPYFFACIDEINRTTQLAVNTAHLYKVFFGQDSIDCVMGNHTHAKYHVQGRNCGDWAFLALTPLDHYNESKVDFLLNPQLRSESGTMFYMKACFKRNIFVFEKQGFKISYRKDNARPYRQQTHFVKVSVKNGHARLTVRKGVIKEGMKKRTFRINTNYFSFKNLAIIKQLAGVPLVQAIYPGAEHTWVQNLLAHGENWKVSFKEFRALTTYKEFLQAHFTNIGSALRVTKRMELYPLEILMQLSRVSDPFTARVLQEFLSKQNINSINGGVRRTNSIFDLYLTTKLSLSPTSEQSGLVVDYISMCQQLSITPNVKIRSIKRLESEHDIVSKELLNKNMPDFAIEPTSLLPDNAQGYNFMQIINKDQLVEESVEMKHCVHSYSHSIQRGQSIIYRVTGKERATVEIKALKECYYPVQIKGKFNHSTSENLKTLICSLLTGTKPILSQQVFAEEDLPF